MLIISDFKDYYDSATMEVEKSIVYRRERKEINRKVIKPDGFWGFHLPNPGVEYRYIVAGFCGKTYMGLMDLKEKVTVWGEEIYPYYLEKRSAGITVTRRQARSQKMAKGTLETLLKRHHDRESELIFMEERVPCWYTVLDTTVVRDPHLVLNPNLSELGFGKIEPAYHAFEKIRNFISERMVSPPMEAREMTDLEKVSSKGFDTKWSFRNPDPPRRKRK